VYLDPNWFFIWCRVVYLFVGMDDTDSDGLSNGNGCYENMQLVAVSQQCRDMDNGNELRGLYYVTPLG